MLFGTEGWLKKDRKINGLLDKSATVSRCAKMKITSQNGMKIDRGQCRSASPVAMMATSETTLRPSARPQA
ncbi:hypothetical protein [Collimonas sp. OK242]|jgi:hypothetical protein|uniref:hypothetical protein n=1 Tax=Collimonas sp. OK242 TaxID=1798195 RepID=UPI00115FBC63|nr:hypothetical protein [Collimonas sp. OK242]